MVVITKAATSGTRTLGYARTEAPSPDAEERGWSVPVEAPGGNVHLEPGTVLKNTYRIDGLIASGGMGDVYRATHLRLQGGVAIKVLHRDLLNEEGLLKRFRTEAKLMAGLHHPHIVHVFDFDVTDDGVTYLAMELAEGSDLRPLSGVVIKPCRLSVGVIRRAMAKIPERRFPSFQEFGQALEEAVLLDLGQSARALHSTSAFDVGGHGESSSERRATRKRLRRGEVDAEAATVFRAPRRPWKMALFFMAAVCAATFLMCMNAQRGRAASPMSASVAYRKLADGAARIMARVRAGGPLAVSTSAATASNDA